MKTIVVVEIMTKRPSFQNRIAYHATLLAGFATISTIMMLLGDMATRDAIAERRAEDMQASLNQVVLPELYDNQLLENRIRLPHRDKTIDVYRGIREGKISVLAYQVSDYGYAGEIVLMMGVDSKGNILGVRVLSHAETPGLGDKMEIKKSRWITGFNGLSTSNTSPSMWAVKKDDGRFDQFTGATITPRAIIRAVKSGLDFFHLHEEKLTMTTYRDGDDIKTGTGK